MSLEFTIEAQEDGERVFADKYDDGVWLSIHIRRGSVSTVLTKAQAQELINALTAIVGDHEVV